MIVSRNSLQKSHFSACSNHTTELQFCKIAVCCYRPGNIHQNQPFHQEFVQVSLLRDCRKTESTLFHFLPKWIHLPSNGASHLSSFQQLATILPQALLAFPSFQLTALRKPLFPGIKIPMLPTGTYANALRKTISELLIFIPARKWSQPPTSFLRVI